VWSRPLPTTDELYLGTPAKTRNELFIASMNMEMQLRDHATKADAAYDDWKWHHAHCIRQRGDKMSPVQSSFAEFQVASHSRVVDDTSPTNEIHDTICKNYKPESNSKGECNNIQEKGKKEGGKKGVIHGRADLLSIPQSGESRRNIKISN
jgi:hypothetical protein